MGYFVVFICCCVGTRVSQMSHTEDDVQQNTQGKLSKQSSCLHVGEKANCREKVLLSEQSLNHLLSLVSVRTPCKVRGSQGSKMPTSQRTRHCTAALPYHCRVGVGVWGGWTAAISAGRISTQQGTLTERCSLTSGSRPWPRSF